MTFQALDHEIDGEGAPVASAVAPVSLDSDTLQQWQNELGEFVAHTRLRLQSLSESLTRWQNAQRAIESETHTLASQNATLRDETSDVETDLASCPESESVIEDPVQPIVDLDLTDDAAPLDRLAAIKLRLAKQIENA